MTSSVARFLTRPVARRPLWQHLCALAALLALCVGLFVWFGAAYLPDAMRATRRQIINDTYGGLTLPLAQGAEVRQSMAVQGTQHGVVLGLTTHGRVVRGTLHLRLYDQAGQLAAQCDADMAPLLDNTFHEFLWQAPVRTAAPTLYTLCLSATPSTPADVVSFFRSEGFPPDYAAPEDQPPAYAYPLNQWHAEHGWYTLQENGQAVDGMLALQFITHHAGHALVAPYCLFAAVLCVFVLALYVLCFMLRAPAHRLFAVCALGLGTVFLFLTPPLAAPDEYAHVATAYHYSNVVLGTAEGDSVAKATLNVRAGDEMPLLNYSADSHTPYALADALAAYTAPAPARGPMVNQPARVFYAWPLLLLPQTLGVLAARLLGLNTAWLLLLGRVCNLLFYVLVVSCAVKRMPFARPMLAVAGILPMCLQLAASFSYDVFAIALGFYFIATCLHYAYGQAGSLVPRQLVWLVVVALLLAPAKSLYLLLIPFILIIPAARYSSRGAARGTRLVAMGAALVATLLVNALIQASLSAPARQQAAPPAGAPALSLTARQGSGVLADRAFGDGLAGGDNADEGGGEGTLPQQTTGGQAAPAATAVGQDPDALPPEALEPNGDARQRFTPGYTLAHLPAALMVVLRSVWQQGPLWLQGLIGGRLGEIIVVDITINWLLVLGLVAVLVGLALAAPGDSHVLARRPRAGSALLFLAVFGGMLTVCLTWTPINYTQLFGMQGRYLLPALPLALLAVRGHALQWKASCWRGLFFAGGVLVALCQLDALRGVLALV